MNYPLLRINLSKILNNCRIINDRCAGMGISVVGVSKCVLGDVKIVRAMRDAGIEIIGDSRLSNLKKIRNHFGPDIKLVLLRTPMISEVEDMISICNLSMNTQLETVREISEVCSKRNMRHGIIIMIETDDRREGILPEEVLPFCKDVLENCKFVDIVGIGTNARCISKRKPRKRSIELLIKLKELIEDVYGLDLPVISGGNSSILDLIYNSAFPEGINQIRIGEAILLGHETAGYRNIDGTYQDCFILDAEVIEIKKKNGKIYKAILALGLQDVNCKNIFSIDPNLDIISQSSDHTVISISSGRGDNIKIGDIISFNLNYFGLLSSMTSPFIEKKYIES
jgi:ornithine racemase